MGQRPNLAPVVLSIEGKLRRAGKGKCLVIGNVNEGLVELIKEALAIRNQLLSGSTIQDQLLSGSDASIAAMAERLGIAKGRLTWLVRLSYLAPGIVRALLAGRQPIELTPTRLLRLSKDLPHDWSDQRDFLGFAGIRTFPMTAETENTGIWGPGFEPRLTESEFALDGIKTQATLVLWRKLAKWPKMFKQANEVAARY